MGYVRLGSNVLWVPLGAAIVLRYCFYAKLEEVGTVWTSGCTITPMFSPHGYYSIIAELVCCDRKQHFQGVNSGNSTV